ncbi:MAG: DUF814 domain-containing protein [Planctomycetota bacterium]|nr:MAG: DUF814 domain-containing protein [Planctomycetota bacterium]
MFSAADVARWAEEGAPALRGTYVHRIWRTDDGWALLARRHENDDPNARAVERVALDIGLAREAPRCVVVPPERVAADDKRCKKAAARDAHPFLSLLRKRLVGCRVLDFEQVAGDRILRLRCERSERAAAEEGPRGRSLIVEFLGRRGNLLLVEQGAPEEGERIVRALEAGPARRPLAEGEPYAPPPPRPGGPDPEPRLCPELSPDPETLRLGIAVSTAQRARAAEVARQSRRAELLRATRKAIARAEGVLRKLEAQLREVERADEYERLGDLLKANLGRLPRQAGRVTVTDYTREEPRELELELDPQRTVREAMEGYYKKAKKLRKGEVHVRTRQGETDALVADLQAIADELSALSDDDQEALDRCERALRRLKALPRKTAAPKQKQQPNQGPRRFRTKEGHEVLVGRNDMENDRLTMRMARGRDLFFHVAGCPGSHVILRVDPQRPPNHESLLDAASLAAYYSKARQRGFVDVHYTPRKWVKKPKGAKPGLVTISNYKTVRASGSGERVQRVLASARSEDDEHED